MASSDSSSTSSESEEEVWTGNEGQTTDDDGETPAEASMRAECALVTASCPRTYLRDREARKRKNQAIPEDFTTEEFLRKFRRVFDANSNRDIQKATCHDEPHKRFRQAGNRRERHKHIALKASGNFAHKKIADAFQRATGIRVSFSFKQKRFGGYLRYLMTPGKKPSTDLDLAPAKYPPNLDLDAELAQQAHPGEAGGRKVRKRLSFDELSNLIMEGVGDGPIRRVKDLESAALALKQQGNVELWNTLGLHKSPQETQAVLSRVWRLAGSQAHPLFRSSASYAISQFRIAGLERVQAWLGGQWQSHTLVLSGDGGLGKTALAKALILKVCPAGFWFLDDIDDFREIDGMLRDGEGLVVDEIELSQMKPNHVKKLLDLEETRRISCRHFNGTIPAKCPRIFCTNSSEKDFFPVMKSAHDEKGVKRRQLFQVVPGDLRLTDDAPSTAAGSASASSTSRGDVAGWEEQLSSLLREARAACYAQRAIDVCKSLGVAYFAEVQQNAVDIADQLHMKPLERSRFLTLARV